MGKLKDRVAVIGEGPTEYYYIQSLADLFKGVTIKPDYPKHTSMKELAKKIAESVDEGYSYVFCIIDMDNKDTVSEMKAYRQLKEKYREPVIKKKKGIHCEVTFYETHPCTELFFYYYFKYTTQYFDTQEALLKALDTECHYEKSAEFFRKCKGLHTYFEKNGGSLEKAINHSDRSMQNNEATGNGYTYSGLGRMIEKLSEVYRNTYSKKQ